MTGVILLAAGNSSRMGRPKQLLPFHGSTLLRHAAETALATALGPVVVVLGAGPAPCREALAGLDVHIALNPEWEQGMGTSIRAGVLELERLAPKIDGALILLHDQPSISAARLRALVSARTPQDATVASAYDGVLGVPAFFTQELFPELRQLSGREGARAILQKHGTRVRRFDLPEASHDIDTPADYDRLRAGRELEHDT